MRTFAVWLACLLCALGLSAQGEYVVDWTEAGDTLVPTFATSVDVGTDYADWQYQAIVAYPELEEADERLLASSSRYGSEWINALPAWPEIHTYLGVSAKRGVLDVEFIPMIRRDGKLWLIRSFDLKIVRTPSVPSVSVGEEPGGSHRARRASAKEERYADHSVLASGNWYKIGVPKDGLYALSAKQLKKMGFNDLSKVRVFGYGGHVLPENDIELLADDLPEVRVLRETDRIVFWGNGTIAFSRDAEGLITHIQNTYATEGCYFVTESETSSVEDATSLEQLLPEEELNATYACTLIEEESYAFISSGRKLFGSYDYANGAEHVYAANLPGITAGGKAFVTVSFAHNSSSPTTVDVSVNDVTLGSLSISSNAAYSDANVAESTFSTTSLTESSRITLKHNRGTGVSGRLDYILICYPVTKESHLALFTSTIGEPSLKGKVTNSDLHNIQQSDYVIVVPASGKLTEQAERLAEAHRTHDGLKVDVVNAETIYNEFSSGTPDATAIRRFMKMLYDRASNEEDAPRYLLLFGDGASDNRMLSSDWKNCSPEDYLLCFESINSFSHTRSYVMEDYFALLDDGEGNDLLKNKPDIGVGRFPLTTENEARIAVDKAIAYMNNEHAGAWKNTILMMGDDGDNNQHMEDAEYIASMIESTYPKFMLKRIYWDTYPMEVTATGNSYPAVHKRILELLDEGALMVNYSGHGRADVLSHELVIDKSDMEGLTSPRLPLWVTASCDISPFDHTATSFGESAFLNEKGGAIALFTTTRTVFASYNRRINYLFSKALFSRDAKSRRLRLGDAVRKAKTEIISSSQSSMQDVSENKLHFVLLGDPALIIGNNECNVVVDKMGGKDMHADDAQLMLKAGEIVTVNGHIEHLSGEKNASFEGAVYPTVLDNRETVMGRNNNGSAEEPFSYVERAKVLFSGSDSIHAGEFSFTFRVPLDINYSKEDGLLNLYAIDNKRETEAQGLFNRFSLGGTTEELSNDSVGPTIFLYLNTPDFVSGDKVNESPLLVATLEDKDGINTIGNGIGHDIIAIVDGSASMTYKLNNYYVSDFGNYTKGSLSYTLPALPAGHHSLMLRAWDMLNNSSSVTIEFDVVEGLNYNIDIFDMQGRLVWNDSKALTTDINALSQLSASAFGLPRGMYVFRVTTTDGANVMVRKMLMKQ
ncbi:MAG: type IX secretion system sortase PorU [Bacteroidaceae bacterium]|nr:type IX secretion system sortase PorU [Bacteroidaceae bacterium]